MLIHGIEETDKEKTDQLVLDVINKDMDIHLPISAIERTHRIGTPKQKKKKSRPIIVKFVRYYDRKNVYVNKRCISESGRLISDILEICDKQKIGGFLVTMDIEKAFDSLDHNFLLTLLAKFGFGNNFLSWIKILLKKQLSCVINGGFTTSYFNLEKGARQGDPASAYLFILVLEVLFISIKNNQNIKGLEIFKHEFLYTAYADDSTFFLKNIK